MKTCCRCKTAKLDTDFHLDRRSPDGLSSQCRPCNIAKVLAWRASGDNRKRTNAANQRWRDRNPEKDAAHQIICQALKRGDLCRKPCAVCDSLEVEAHHFDYNKPLEVIWLCKAHHCALDRTGPRASKPFRLTIP